MEKITEPRVKKLLDLNVEMELFFTLDEDLSSKHAPIITIENKEHVLFGQKGYVRRFSANAALQWAKRMGLMDRIVFDSNKKISLTA